MNPTLVSVLIVDDDPTFVAVLESLLAALDLNLKFSIEHVDTADKALHIVHHQRFDLVLLDNKLPGGDGLELLEDFRDHAAVIMLTATGSEAIAVEAMKRGAKDYLPKLELSVPGLSRAITNALNQRHLEQKLAHYTEELRQKNELLETDLYLARDVQQAFLPQKYPRFRNDALRFHHRYLPTDAVGGDFFDVLPISDTAAGVFICDVMGHGIRAALVTAILRGLIEKLTPLANAPGQFLTEINRGVMDILKQQRQTTFTSACYLVVDVAAQKLHYANAGHPAPLHIWRKAGKISPLATGKDSAALGLIANHEYNTATYPLAKGDRILLFTDGLFEVHNAQHEQFDEQHLLAAARARLATPAPQLLDGLIAEARQFSHNHEFADDVCLVAVEVNELL